MVEVSVKGRAIYTITNKLEPVHENMRTELISFYEKPTGPFVREVYLCLLRDVVDRWAILGAPCNESKNQFFGFKLYVGSSELNNPAYPSIKVNVANNRKLGMPFGTRVFTKDEDKICCQGGADLIDFKPCCHYRWYPWKFSMPVGWSGWGEWQECSNSCEQIRKRLCLGNKGDCKVFWSKSNKTPWMEKRKCPSCDNRKVATPPPKKNAKKSPKQSNKKYNTIIILDAHQFDVIQSFLLNISSLSFYSLSFYSAVYHKVTFFLGQSASEKYQFQASS